MRTELSGVVCAGAVSAYPPSRANTISLFISTSSLRLRFQAAGPRAGGLIGRATMAAPPNQYSEHFARWKSHFLLEVFNGEETREKRGNRGTRHEHSGSQALGVAQAGGEGLECQRLLLLAGHP